MNAENDKVEYEYDAFYCDDVKKDFTYAAKKFAEGVYDELMGRW